MSTPVALYYPHTNITDTNIIKNSLLLWDQVEYITPTKSWDHFKFPSKSYNEAIDIISKPHHPTPTERNRVHERVATLIKNGLPPWFFLNAGRNIKNFENYTIYPEKLDSKTWNLLKEHDLVKFDQNGYKFHTSAYFGLMIMSLLADSCAGVLKRKITDRADAYSWLQKYSTAEAGGDYIFGLDVSQVSPAYERLVTISIKVLDTDHLPITSLLEMRKREARSSSNDYRGFRIKYLNKVDEYVDRIVKPGLLESDIKELERQFQKDMEQEIKDLRYELRVSKDKLLWSKEVGISLVAAAGSLTSPITGLTDLASLLGTIGVGALIKVGKEYNVARRKVLKESPMSLLYLSNRNANKFNARKIIL